MEYRHNPPSLHELREMRKPIRITRRAINESLSWPERFAVYMTHHIGSLGFFFLLLIWTFVWLGWNIYAPESMRFDPAPAFVIWLFASNILQLIFLPLIMVGQNTEGRAADKRAQADYEINQKAEREVEVILAHLENQNELLLELARKVERGR